MLSHVLILAALSATTLAKGISLTAFDHNDQKCKGKAIGKEIHFTHKVGECKIYQPEQTDAYIRADFYDLDEPIMAYNIDIYSDTGCQTKVASIKIDRSNPDHWHLHDCYSMASIWTGPWGSAMTGDLN